MRLSRLIYVFIFIALTMVFGAVMLGLFKTSETVDSVYRIKDNRSLSITTPSSPINSAFMLVTMVSVIAVVIGVLIPVLSDFGSGSSSDDDEDEDDDSEYEDDDIIFDDSIGAFIEQSKQRKKSVVSELNEKDFERSEFD